MKTDWYPRKLLFPLALVLVQAGSMALVGSVTDVLRGVDIYDELARNLALGNGFVVYPGDSACLWRGPVYPLLLASWWKVVGVDNYAGLLVLQAALSVGAASISYAIALRFMRAGAAVVAALLIVANPLVAYYALRYSTETLFCLLIAAVVLLIYRTLESDRTGVALAAGAVAGLAVLTRPAGILLPVVTAAALAISGARRPAAWLIVGSLFVTIPWTVRNFVVSGELIPVATGGGYSIWLGNRVESDGLDDDEIPEAQLAEFERARAEVAVSEEALQITAEMDRRFSNAALEGVRKDPVGTAELLVKKAYRFWFAISTPRMRRFGLAVGLIQAVLLAAAALGSIRLSRRGSTVWPIWMVVCYFFAIHTLVIATVRYSIPLTQFLIVLAVAGVVAPRSPVGGRSLIPIQRRD